MTDTSYREESDSMGTLRVPASCLWGAQTQRALENGPFFQFSIPGPMLRALAIIKSASARANGELGIVEKPIAEAIDRACEEVLEGKHDNHFPVGVFQTGSGTSWNMNMNEVIANRANQLLGHPPGKRFPVHPNDHVNRCQSSNDVIPSAMNIAARIESGVLAEVLDSLKSALDDKVLEFKDIPKLGRTHLQDALPLSLGQEFSGYAAQVGRAFRKVKASFSSLESLALGGTAIGTGAGAVPGFSDKALACITEKTGVPFHSAENRFAEIASRDCMLESMGALNLTATVLMKIAQDLRLLSSGPRGGLGEIRLPELQPGSSIMPGKINPVIPEIVLQAGAYVTGAVTSVTVACQNAPLELNIMQPLIAHQVISSLLLLSDTVNLFAKKCVTGITADRITCAGYIEQSLAMATPLASLIGYDRAAEIAREAFSRGVTVRQAALEAGIEREVVDKALDVNNLISGKEQPGG